VAISYLVVIVALAIPRVIDSSWRSILSPRDMRNLEGYPVQWEAFLVLRSLYAMASNQVPDDLIEWYSTDEYRATLPTYHATIVSQITRSPIIGITTSEVIWWWMGALGVFMLARSFVSAPTAYCAGILTCASPLGVGHVGAAHLHTASSLSLSVILAIAWRLIHDSRFDLVPKAALYGACLYLSSITYTYQWFLAPFFVVVTAFPKVSRERLFASVLGIGIFLALRVASYGILALGGLEVHAHQNDPVRFVLSQVSGLFPMTAAQLAHIWSRLVAELTIVILGTVSSYHAIIVVSTAIGLLFVRDAQFGVATGTAVMLAFAFGAIYDIAWVLMTGYPLVYTLAAHGMARGSRTVASRLPFLRDDPRTPLALLAACTSVAAILTNLDLVGDPAFAIGWWGWWYQPH
jgi:hypothetical protein